MQILTWFKIQLHGQCLWNDDVIKWKHFPSYWHFEEFTGDCWIPLTNASDVEFWCFLWSAPEQTVVQTIEKPAIWNAIMPNMSSLQWNLTMTMDGHSCSGIYVFLLPCVGPILGTFSICLVCLNLYACPVKVYPAFSFYNHEYILLIVYISAMISVMVSVILLVNNIWLFTYILIFNSIIV